MSVTGINQDSLRIRPLANADHDSWAAFVLNHPRAVLYHTPQWSAFLEKVFGHRALHLIGEDDRGIRGILPLFLVRLPVLGSKLISIPYDIGSGGVLTSDVACERLLVRRGIEIARGLGANFLQLRYDSPRPALDGLGFSCSQPVIISDVTLDNEESVWARIQKDQRKAVGKAERRGIVVRVAETLADYLDFYRIYLKVFREFGTPPYGPAYFRSLWEDLHPWGGVRLLLACSGEKCVGGLLLYCWGSNLVSKFAVCLSESLTLRPYPALYWSAMKLGIETGHNWLSWGTSSPNQAPLIEFKERWGATSRPVSVYDLTVAGSPPDLASYYDSRGFIRSAWKKLPVSLTSILGAHLNRWFC